MKSIDIEMKIREVVQLYRKTSKGWESCVHSSCDHGKKGPRAAFKFSPNSIAFNCFNCGEAAILNLEESTNIPKKFNKILEDFGMSKREIDEINFQLLSDNANNSFQDNKKSTTKQKSIIPTKIKIPKDFVMLHGNEDTDVGKLALLELERRKINPDDYPFMLCIKGANKTRKMWEKRLVIPTFKDDDVIFYQAQDLTGKSPTKYLNASDENIDRSKIISNYDALFEKTNNPLYVIEGWYDAYHINGVAIFGNRIKENQVAWLNKSYRDKVFIPDRYGDGSKVALECLERGWKISVPYRGLDDKIKDISDMVSTYGKLYTMKMIKENTSLSEIDAKIKISQLID